MAKFNRNAVTQDTDDEVVPDTSADRPRRTRTVNSIGAVSSGWGAAPVERKETVKSDQLKLKDSGKRIVKILDEAPAVKYGRHYVRSAGSNGRYFTCLNDDARTGECPLCDKGLYRTQTFIMNVVDMTADPSQVLTWTFGNEVSTALQSLMENPQGDYWPVNDDNRYFHVYHEKIANREAPATRVLPLKARDLQDDYGIEPLTTDELAALEDELYGDEVVFINDYNYLAAVEVRDSDLPQKRQK